jgi:hypothetical protein
MIKTRWDYLEVVADVTKATPRDDTPVSRMMAESWSGVWRAKIVAAMNPGTIKVPTEDEGQSYQLPRVEFDDGKGSEEIDLRFDMGRCVKSRE